MTVSLIAGSVPMQHVWQCYCNQLVRRPLVTKVATGVLGTIIGDGIAQAASHITLRNSAAAASMGEQLPTFQYDWARMARLCLYAAMLGTTIGHYWFAFLDNHVLPSRIDEPFIAVVKMGLDQVIMAPIGTVLLWPAANFINFKFVPPEQRVLYINLIWIGWISFLSTMMSSPPSGTQTPRHARPAGQRAVMDLAGKVD